MKRNSMKKKIGMIIGAVVAAILLFYLFLFLTR